MGRTGTAATAWASYATSSSIRERPAEAEDRAVPGHWEGDLIRGTGGSAIGTLVERTSRLVLLVKLDKVDAETVAAALRTHILTLPAHLRRSLTWDQGKEMGRHVQFSIDTGVAVYFCDPKSPWQRGSNENTNHWFLPSYTFPSCLPDPDRLAVPTRPGVVEAASHPPLHLQGQAASSFTGLLRQTPTANGSCLWPAKSARAGSMVMTAAGIPWPRFGGCKQSGNGSANSVSTLRGFSRSRRCRRDPQLHGG